MDSETNFARIRENLEIARNNIDRQSPDPAFYRACMNVIVNIALRIKTLKEITICVNVFHLPINIITDKYCGFQENSSIPEDIKFVQVQKNIKFVSWFVRHCIQLNQIDYQDRIKFLEERKIKQKTDKIFF